MKQNVGFTDKAHSLTFEALLHKSFTQRCPSVNSLETPIYYIDSGFMQITILL